MSASPVKEDYSLLTEDTVRQRIDYGQYEVRKPDRAGKVSKAYSTIHRVYDAVSGAEVGIWHRCLECEKTWQCLTKDGTSRLMAHQNLHLKEKAKKAAQATTSIIATSSTSTNIAKPSSSSVATSESKQQLTNQSKIAQITEQLASIMLVDHQIPSDDLCKSFAMAMHIGWQYGPLNEGTIADVLPEVGQWYEIFISVFY